MIAISKCVTHLNIPNFSRNPVDMKGFNFFEEKKKLYLRFSLYCIFYKHLQVLITLNRILSFLLDLISRCYKEHKAP